MAGKYHGVMFKTPLVQAIKEGRKRQTRRPVKLPKSLAQYGSPKWDKACPGKSWDGGGSKLCLHLPYDGNGIRDDCTCQSILSPINVGDVIWVRETWNNAEPGPTKPGSIIVYRADYLDDPHGPDGEKSPEGRYRFWRPSVHMPRWACRMFLPITSVRCERVEAITEEDAAAEGVHRIAEGIIEPYSVPPKRIDLTHRDYFLDAWERIYGSTEGWCWVYEWFEVLPAAPSEGGA